MKKLIILSIIVIASAFAGQSQTTDSTKKFKIEPIANVTLTNQYVWRGSLQDGKPNIQPLLALNSCGVEVGALGSLSLFNNYSEIDVYASYTYKAVKFMVTDFYIDYSGISNSQDYFNLSDSAKLHNVTCDLILGGTKKIPLKLTASTLVYGGLDKDANNNPKYTTYIELRFPYKKFEIFVGGLTRQSDFYLNKIDAFNVVNAGAAYNSEFKSIPVSTQIAVNPQMQKIYLTINVTF